MRGYIRGNFAPILAGMIALAICGCGGNGDDGGSGGSTAFGITPTGNLVRFDKSTPGAVVTTGPITGLSSGETILALDIRPLNGQLYALGSTGRLYTINTNNAQATAVGPAFTPGLSGSVFGFDFNPVVDRVRVVSASEQNFRLNPDTGAVAGTDTNLAYIIGDPNAGNTPDIAAAAYTNNALPPPGSTTLYVIDTSRDVLATLGGLNGNPSPNTGGLVTVGPLGVDASSGPVSFDISGNGTALAVMTVGGTRGLYSINLATGAATLIGALSTDVSEIAITL